MIEKEYELVYRFPMNRCSITEISRDVSRNEDETIVKILKKIKIDPDVLLKTTLLNRELQEELQKVIKERDAAISDLREISVRHNSCRCCSHKNEKSFCGDCDYRSMNNWEWRGIQNDE